MKQKIFLVIGILILSIFGISIFSEFMVNHTYYNGMFSNGQNRWLIIWSLISAFIPIAYILWSKKFKMKTFLTWMIPLGLITFSIAHISIKEGIFGSNAFLILCLNTILLYGLGIYFILGTTALGIWISDKWIKFRENRRQEMMLKFGIGLGILLLIVYVLAMTRILRGGLIWILFAGLGFMIWYMKAKLIVYRELVEEIFTGFKIDYLRQDMWKWIGLILIGVGIIYYFYGFQLSFIPYSTAWDANHAYMYEPKVLAENFGVLRSNIGAASSIPGLRHMFITFWFALITPIKSRFWLAPDTIAVAMNFLSGILVMLFGIGTIKEIIEYFKSKFHTVDGNKNAFEIAFYAGRSLILLWLTSGMGAFLVFVDNKTDLGVMALTILAILSGFIFLKFVSDDQEQGEQINKNSLKYIITSGIMFTRAIMAKPTAFIDVALFGLLLVALWIDQIIALGLGIITIGMMGVMQVANAPDLLAVGPGKVVMIIGLIITILGFVRMFAQKHVEGFGKDKKRLLKYIMIWGLTFFISLLVLKGPNMAIRDITQGTFNLSNWVKSTLLLGVRGEKLEANDLRLTTTEDMQAIEQQTAIDQQVLAESRKLEAGSQISPSIDSCKSQTFTKQELEEDMRKAVAGNEDVGRYVGYGWKDITKGGGLNLGYGLLRLFYPTDNICYGLNSDAKLLCKNAQAIDTFNIDILQGMMGDVPKSGQAYELLSGAINAYKAKKSELTGAFNPAEFRDQILALRSFYQDHSIYTQYGKISIPYRYLVPFNVVFNRSLQNLSSYYTDIGFIWMFMLIFIVMGLIYALVQKNKNLITLSGVTIIGRGVWWIIGGGIVWYGMGLIMRTILTVTLFLKDLFERNKDENDNTMFYIIIFLLAGRSILQLFFNLIRISSQGAGGPFLRYKTNVGKTIELSDTLQQQEVIKAGYTRKDVFDLQFPHYNKFMNATKDRKNSDGVLIAGTYLQYFLQNQHNIKGDGMLSWFREQTSDNDGCKSYKRLQENNIKYLVIDPNIGTVVMGEGNESLFNRFFAKKDPVSGKIEDNGAISTIIKLWKDGYLKLFGTNNLGAKYALSLDDATLKATFGDVSDDELIFIRAKLCIARFFPDAQELIGFIGTQFINRIGNNQAIGDIADVYGKTIDEKKVTALAKQRIEGKSDQATMQKSLGELTQDERFILAQYLGLYNIYKAQNQQQLQEIANNILGQSLGGSSQLIVLELN